MPETMAQKYQVPPKLFKRLGTESEQPPPSPKGSGRGLGGGIGSGLIYISPRIMLTKSKVKSQVLSNIPRILDDCVDYLLEDDRDKTEGLFRIPGDSENVDKLILMYESKELESEDILRTVSPPVHDAATLMKRYLMKLAHPLIDSSTKKDMISIFIRGTAEDKDKQLVSYEVVIRALDIEEQNRIALGFLLRFLLMISNEADEGSRMSVEAYARLFAPIIMRDDDGTMEMIKHIDTVIVVTEILIWNALELMPK